MKKYAPLFLSLAAFFAVTAFSGAAADGARRGLDVCFRTLVPSLLPFFVLANLLSALGLPELLAGAFGVPMRKLFHVSGSGAQAFFIGLSGGYPLGAATVAELRRSGRVSKSEAERLLGFCNNSGPAFAIGALGGVFHSAGAGLLLYGTHVLAAVCVGLVMRGHASPPETETASAAPAPFPAALSTALTRALGSTLSVCVCVVFFSALLGLLPLGALPPLPAALFAGVLELGSGAGALSGLAPSPVALAAAAFMLGWGGLSVHCQTLAAVADTDIACARHLAGRALCGVFAAVFTYLASLVML